MAGETNVFNTSECAWSHISVDVLGRKFVGLRGFEVDLEIEKEHLYAAGSKPIDIQDGNEKPTGNFKLLKFEVDLMNDAAQAAGYLNVLKVPHTLISGVIQFKKRASDPIRTIIVPGIAFTKMTFGMEQGAKMMEVTMPFLAMDILLKKTV